MPFISGERVLPVNAQLSMSNIVKISALGAATLLFVAPFGEFAGEFSDAKSGWLPRVLFPASSRSLLYLYVSPDSIRLQYTIQQ